MRCKRVLCIAGNDRELAICGLRLDRQIQLVETRISSRPIDLTLESMHILSIAAESLDDRLVRPAPE